MFEEWVTLGRASPSVAPPGLFHFSELTERLIPPPRVEFHDQSTSFYPIGSYKSFWLLPHSVAQVKLLELDWNWPQSRCHDDETDVHSFFIVFFLTFSRSVKHFTAVLQQQCNINYFLLVLNTWMVHSDIKKTKHLIIDNKKGLKEGHVGPQEGSRVALWHPKTIYESPDTHKLLFPFLIGYGGRYRCGGRTTGIENSSSSSSSSIPPWKLHFKES